MARKRITELMPFLIPIRTWQRIFFYRIGMILDKNTYAKTFLDETLPYEVCGSKTTMINENSGFAIEYQENKVHNLKVISQTMNKIVINPHETFSFCYLARKSKKYGKYKEGLILINGKIVPRKGGGICHLSNLLYYVFLLSPLTIVERHGHKVKSLPNPDPDALEGIDATISDGWLDLKVRNDTNDLFQVVIDFDETCMYARIYSNSLVKTEALIFNEDFKYLKKEKRLFESVAVMKKIIDKETKEEIETKHLYDEVVEVTYEIPKEILDKNLQ